MHICICRISCMSVFFSYCFMFFLKLFCFFSVLCPAVIFFLKCFRLVFLSACLKTTQHTTLNTNKLEMALFMACVKCSEQCSNLLQIT